MTSNDAPHGATQPAEPIIRRTEVADTNSGVSMIKSIATIAAIVSDISTRVSGGAR